MACFFVRFACLVTSACFLIRTALLCADMMGGDDLPPLPLLPLLPPPPPPPPRLVSPMSPPPLLPSAEYESQRMHVRLPFHVLRHTRHVNPPPSAGMLGGSGAICSALNLRWSDRCSRNFFSSRLTGTATEATESRESPRSRRWCSGDRASPSVRMHVTVANSSATPSPNWT